ncbi:HNH endonuclease [Archangium lansingense]|uniref:HNH endonuclease signature motif containing protein n=1 Tax=Archangium lansingense TaxID=2995310 RepID=A0ABT4AEQ9_9BACT|nr:HNH endonuclease signature motif containing protein [Archangium lansinium]MCY1079684.1 HNH endonuclease signature motif containing protein [Archangium lansinium]
MNEHDMRRAQHGMSAFPRNLLQRMPLLLLIAGLAAIPSFAQPSLGTGIEVARIAEATVLEPLAQQVLPADAIAIAAGKKGGQPPPKGTANGDRAYMRFTPKGKKDVKDENAKEYDGEKRCENCDVPTVDAQKSQKGVTPPGNETQVDHVIPRAKGGDGSPSNGQVLCRECNNAKSDKL